MAEKRKGGKLKWIIIAVVVLGVIGAVAGGSNDNKTTDAAKINQETEQDTEKDVANSESESKEDTKTESEETDIATDDGQQEADPDDSLTMGQKNALAKADDYLNYSAFSHDGLIQQLEFEGFSNEEATYAADNCGADWNEQAAKKAQEYLDYSSFSRSGLIDQLKFEGFTDEQAEYGVTAVGY